MDKSIKWDENYDFFMLDMMQKFTDEELAEIGMDPEKIKEFREWQKKNSMHSSEEKK